MIYHKAGQFIVKKKMMGQMFQIFNKFQKSWQNINKTNYLSGMEDNVVLQKLTIIKDDILKYSFDKLQQRQPRNNYVEWVIIFFGETTPTGINFERAYSLCSSDGFIV